MRLFIVPVAALAATLGCSSSDSNPSNGGAGGSDLDAAVSLDVAADTATADDAAADTAPVDDASPDASPDDATSDAPTGACAFVGSWRLTKFLCGTTDITSNWTAIVATTTWVVTATSSGCHVVLTNDSTSCNEVQSYDWVIAADGTVTSSTTPGITSCNPASCTFTTGDAPCVVGDRASGADGGGTSAKLTLVGGNIEASFDEAGGLCGGQTQHQTFVPD